MGKGLRSGSVALIGILLAALTVHADSSSIEVIQKMGTTSINWSEGYIEAEGVGKVPETVLDKPKAYVLALETAKANAFRNLFEIVKSVRVDSLTELRDLIRQDEALRAKVDVIVARSHIEERVFSYSQKRVKVVLRTPLRGDLIRAVLPMYKGARTEPEIPAPPAAVNGQPAPQFPGSPLSPPEKAPASQPVIATGLLIDAKGVQPGPALIPRILDESGREVYGPLQVDAETAAQQGLAVYYRCISCPQAERRLDNKPLVLKAIRTEGPGRSNILISNADAEKIRAANSVSPFLSKAKVIISTD